MIATASTQNVTGLVVALATVVAAAGPGTLIVAESKPFSVQCTLVTTAIARRYKFTDVGHVAEVFGTCATCRAA